MSNVMSFKMISGEEVVAELVSTKTITENSSPISYTVRRPHVLQFQPVGPGQLGLAFVPWTLSNPAIERLEIPASAILLTFTPVDKVERQYLEQTSGISLAGAGMQV
jgi:hypothetical protein